MARKPGTPRTPRPSRDEPAGKPRREEKAAPRGPVNAPKFRPQTPKGTTFRKPSLELFTTTLWEYPSQHYMSDSRGGSGRAGVQGDPNYTGATPSWVIWQLLQRYTVRGERVLDPMCGSGTTLDVCEDLGREGKGFDLAPSRADIARADARELPLPDSCCDFVFIDPPYSTHVEYSNHLDCIGRLDAGGRDGGRAYYEAMRRVIGEADRVLRPGKHMALYVSDSWRKRAGGRRGAADEGEFMPIGFELYSMLRERFEPVDIVAVVRQNAKLKRGKWHEAASEENFFLRGFNYLFIMRKAGRNAEAAEGTQRAQRGDRGRTGGGRRARGS